MSDLGISMIIEQTITYGNLVEIFAIVSGGVTVFATLKSTVANVKTEVAAMQVEIKKLGEILVAQADIRGELKGLGARADRNEQDIRDLQHAGIRNGSYTRSIDGEYPR